MRAVLLLNVLTETGAAARALLTPATAPTARADVGAACVNAGAAAFEDDSAAAAAGSLGSTAHRDCSYTHERQQRWKILMPVLDTQRAQCMRAQYERL